MSTAMRAHLAAKIGSVVGQVVAPDWVQSGVTGAEEEPNTALPAVAGVVTSLLLLVRRYNFF
jgi:hypothetical protein